ncbi:hypothetical protein L0F81_02790 [Streptomyces tricolor]|uniref:Uncharacterized protein n=1 Tax=Streptomyces tricolor TaxID=68277 RepID=A0ABS9J9H8_9ACTN|nr:hypothetical protein [Streptomyces tricolor]MCG0062223.1 hypothetical protein [Streptomyces tricolor]
MTVQIADELARLHRLVSWFEVPLNLPSSALAGEACVWCVSPVDGTSVELEPSTPLPRWGCMPCYSARLAWYVSWYDWHRHFDTCLHCQQRRTCYIGHGRRVLHEQTMGPIDKHPECFICPSPLLAGDLVGPVRWEGDSRLYLGYAHLRCMTGRPSSR